VNRQRRKLAAAARGEDPSGWAREFWEAMRPHASGVGGYVNFMSEIDEDRVRASYGPDAYARLARIKGEWDPDNVFHLNANIKPG
jgi:FAD/FMN-containing dehydrogenase